MIFDTLSKRLMYNLGSPQKTEIWAC